MSRRLTRRRDVLPLRRILAQLPGIISQDRPFRWVISTRVLLGLVGIASAFYVLNATQNAGLSIEASGYFVSAQVAGSLTGGLLTTVLQDRWGPLVHIRTIIVVSAVAPLVALVCQPLLATLGAAVLYPYLLVYVALGIYMGSTGWPFFNWILEYAEEAKRPLYIGMINTFGAITMVTPAVGAGSPATSRTRPCSCCHSCAPLPPLPCRGSSRRRGGKAEVSGPLTTDLCSLSVVACPTAARAARAHDA